jgi:hypothetical protein
MMGYFTEALAAGDAITLADLVSRLQEAGAADDTPVFVCEHGGGVRPVGRAEDAGDGAVNLYLARG